MTEQVGTSPEVLPVPKGGGSPRGLGDAFCPDLNRGSGSYSLEVDLPQGYRGLSPNLTLTYDTGNGTGPFGHGWALPLPGVQLDVDSGAAAYLDASYLFEGEILEQTGSDSYRPRVENAFQRIRREHAGWTVTDKTGRVTSLGSRPQSRVTGVVAGQLRTFAWLIDSVTDTSGNEIRYEYFRDSGSLYLKRVKYAVYEVEFDYERRHDVFTDRRAGFAISQRFRCQAIHVRRPDAQHPLIRTYRLEYLDADESPSLLSRVEMEGFKRQPDGSIQRETSPPLEFTYAGFDPSKHSYEVVAERSPVPPGPLSRDRRLLDIGGNGLPDVVELGVGPTRVWRNRGDGQFGGPVRLKGLPSSTGRSALFLDIDGTGTVDVVDLSGRDGRYFPNTGAGGFGRPRFLGRDGRPLGLDVSDRDVTLADVNGDGRVDFIRTTPRGMVTWINRGGELGFALPQVTPRSSDRDGFPDVRLSDPNVFVADMTGDGLPDIVHVTSGLVEYWPSLGASRYDDRQVMENCPDLPRHYHPARVRVADVEGTGTADIIYVGESSVSVWRNLCGARFADPIHVQGTPHCQPEAVRVVDLKGSGTTGVLWGDVRFSRTSRYRFLSFADTRPFLLTHIDEGTGRETTIHYNSSAEHAVRDARKGEEWSTRLPMPVPVVHKIVRHDRVSGMSDSVELNYHNGRWDAASRRFRGFGRVTKRRQASSNAEATFVEYFFLVGADGEPEMAASTPTVDETQASAIRRGQAYRTVYHQGRPSGTPLRVEETHWRVREVELARSAVPILAPEVERTEVWNYEGGAHPRVTTTVYQYDEYGNVTRQEKRGHAPNGDDRGAPVDALTAVTEIEYTSGAANYLVSLPVRIVQRDGADNVLSEHRMFYDGVPFEGLPLGKVTKGLLSRREELILEVSRAQRIYGARQPNWADLGYRETVRIDGEPVLAIDSERYEYTSKGMIQACRGPLGEDTECDYDDDELLVEAVTNSLGHRESARWDASHQIIEKRTDPVGQTTRYTYDGLGRVRRVVRSGDTLGKPTVRYTYGDDQLPRGRRIQERRVSGGPEVYERAVYYDGSGRRIQERSRIDSTRVRVSGPIEVNERGEAVASGQPYYGSGLDFEAPEPLEPHESSTFEYDALGRLVKATERNEGVYEVRYTPWRAEHDGTLADGNSADGSRTEHFDSLGRLVGVSRKDGTASHRANYQYDILGRIISTTDLEGRTANRNIEYDGRGKKLRIDHASAGVRTIVYDARGRVARFWAGQKKPVHRRYDRLGRLSAVEIDGVTVEEYHYDEGQASGRLTRVNDAAGTESFAYDRRGRIQRKTREIGAEVYVIEYDYDAAGDLDKITYPNGRVAVFERWGDRRVKSVDGVVNEFDYDGHGRLTRATHTNGIVESVDYDGLGKLESLVVADGSQSLYEASLVYDAHGHLEQLVTTMPGRPSRTERYEYDDLGHLTKAEHIVDATIEQFDYAYDAAGNLLSSGETEVEQYVFDFGKVGALQGIVSQTGNSEAVDFGAAGQMTSMPGMDCEYDARGRLTKAFLANGGEIEMVYDFRGARVAKRKMKADGSVEETHYVDEIYENQDGNDAAYVMVGGRFVAVMTGTQTRHLHTDHRGSIVLLTRDDGSVEGTSWFSPYGSESESSGTTVSRRFAGAVCDADMDLVYLNQRYYSPKLGRFLTPDALFLIGPERGLTRPVNLNLYTYAGSNPVENVDPTGQFILTAMAVGAAIGAVGGAIYGAYHGGVTGAVAGFFLGAGLGAALGLGVGLLAATWQFTLAGAGLGALIGGVSEGSWEGALMGAAIGATLGMNLGFHPVLGAVVGGVQLFGLFPSVRESDGYKALAGWTSWFAPASWPGHLFGLGVFLANGAAHIVGGSSNQIESVRFDWQHGQFQTVGGRYGQSPFPELVTFGAHNVGGFSFFPNEAAFDRSAVHETGHMLSNFMFGFWQGAINAIDPRGHGEMLFERIAESNQDTERDGHPYNTFWGEPSPPPRGIG